MNQQRPRAPQYGPPSEAPPPPTNMQAEIQKLRQENQTLKEQLKLISDNVNSFTKTVLGIDVPPDIGILITVEEGVVVAWNHTMWETLGYRSDDLFTKVVTWRDLQDLTNSRLAFGVLVQAVREKRESYSLQNRMKRSNGTLIPVQQNTILSYDSITQFPLYAISFITFLQEENQLQ
jgi:PAS domain S-box-containing protein